MNKTLPVLFGALTWLVLVFIVYNQFHLNRLVEQKLASRGPSPEAPVIDPDTMQRTLAELERAQREAALVSRRATEAARQVEALEARLQQMHTRIAMVRQRPMAPVRVPEAPELEPPDLAPPPSVLRGRGWAPEQVVGPPDTMQAGDVSTAWAPKMPDAGSEWLKVDYERSTQVREVRVRETYNPGAIIRVTAVLPGGEEALLWEGEEPPAQAPVDRSFTAAHGNFVAKSIKIYLDTKKVPGWNEIDAVELVGTDGSRQWASQASASSSYADR